MKNARLGEILLDRSWISQEDLRRAIEQQAQSQLPLGQILIAQASITERQLKRALRWQRFARAALLVGSMTAAVAPVAASEAQRLTNQLVDQIAATWALPSQPAASSHHDSNKQQKNIKSLLGTPAWTLLQGRYAYGVGKHTEGMRYQAKWDASRLSLEVRYQF